MKSKKMNICDSQNVFEVDEPEEIDNLSDGDWKPNTAAKTPAKRRRSAQSTPSRRNKPKVADEDNDDEDEEVLPKRDGREKSNPETPAARWFETATKEKLKKEVEPEEEIEEEDEDNNYDDDEDEEVQPIKYRGAKSKVGIPAAKGCRAAIKEKSMKEVEPEEEDEDNNYDDGEDEVVLPKICRGAKSNVGIPAARGCGTATREKLMKEVEPEEEMEDEEHEDEGESDDDENEEDDLDEEDDAEDEEDIDEEEEEEEEEEEDQFDQGPNAKPAENFTSGAFVVLKTDMDDNGNPPVWKIDGKALLQKYIPFKKDGKLLYKKTAIYSGWSSNVREQYFSAPVEFILQSQKEHIIEFFKDKIQKDPKVELKEEEEEEAADLAGINPNEV